MYTTVPNEGSTYGVFLVFMQSQDDVVSSIVAPSASWNSSAHFTGTFRFYRYLTQLQSWHLILSASTVINRSLWFEYDDNRRTPHALTLNLVLRVRRNLFYRYFGLGPDTVLAGESSYTRLYATANARVGGGQQNLTSNLNVGVYGEVRGDCPERHAISGLPETQDLYPDAPGSTARPWSAPDSPSATTPARRATTRRPGSRPSSPATFPRASRASAVSPRLVGRRATSCPSSRSCRERPASTG